MTPYEYNRIYIWQNQVGPLAHINGTETMVIGPVQEMWDLVSQSFRIGQPTDMASETPGRYYFAEAGDLRPKNPPTGETEILKLFKMPEVETA